MGHRPDSVVANRGRRRFLLGSAAALALPFLESLANPKPSYGWTPGAGMPRRLIVLFHGHGTIMEEFVPGPNMSQGAILQPLVDAGVIGKSLIVTGVHSSVQSGHDGAPSLLTCTHVGQGQYHTYGTGPSIDQVIAQHMQDGGLARRLDLAVSQDSTDPNASPLSNEHTRVFWSGDNAGIESIRKPDLAFDRVFPNGPPNGGMPTEPPVDYVALRRESVLDGVLQNFNRLQGRVSASDRERLEAHADRVREIEQSLQNGGNNGPVSPTCNDGLNVALNGLDHQGIAEAQVDILAYAMACNVADVGTFKINDLQEDAWTHVSHPDMAQTFAGENYHGAWHRASDNNQDYARRAFTAINTWYGSLFARLLSRLDQIDEGDGTALDNTMVVWLSDFGHGGGHSADNLPIVIAGNAGGAALGRHVNYAQNPAAQYGDPSQPGNHNLAVTMAQAFGIQSETFGDYSNTHRPVQPGPLSL